MGAADPAQGHPFGQDMLQPAAGWPTGWIKAGCEDLGADPGGILTQLMQLGFLWAPRLLKALELGLATFILNQHLHRVPTSLLNLLNFASLHHIL